MKLPAWLQPNRLVLLASFLLSVLVALASLLTELGAAEAAALVGSLVTILGLGVKFLGGSQQWEREVLAPAARAEIERASAPQLVATTAPGGTLTIEPPGVYDVGTNDVEDLGGYGLDVLDESAEAAAQPHLGDAGMPTSGEREVAP